MRLSYLAAFSLISATGLAADAAADNVKVVIVPFAPLNGQVPVRAGSKVAGLLAGELKNVGNLSPVELAIEQNEAAARALQSARDAVTEAQKLERRRKLGAASSLYRTAIAQYDAAAALISVPADLSDAHTALGTVLYLMGDDAGGAQELRNALALTPARPLPGESTSPLFAATVKKLRGEVLSEQRASLRIESTPAGASATLDGREMGETPLTIKNIPPGKHLWRVLLPSSEPAGGVVTLTGGGELKISAGLGGTSPVSRLITALAANRLDPTALAAAKDAAGGSDLVAFGTLLARTEDLVLETFLYSPARNAVVRLPQKSFDGELLSAGMELFKVAGEIGSRLEELGAPENLPTKISPEARPPELAEKAEIAYTLPGERQEKGGDEARGPRRPIDPSKPGGQLRPRNK
jgi:hypothetical protein